MGNDQSARPQKWDFCEQQKQREIERPRKLREEEENEKRKAEAEEKRQRIQLEKELENKKLELQHQQEMQRIAASEKSSERDDQHRDKTTQLEHERLMQSQEKMLSIAETLFKKVEIRDMQEAAFGLTILQSIQAGKPVDKEVLKAVTAKVPDPPPTDIKRLVHNIIKTCEEEEEAESQNEDVMIS